MSRNQIGKQHQREQVRSLVPIIFKEGKPLTRNEPFDDQTLEQIELANQTHLPKLDKIRGRKRYKTASADAKAGIEQAIVERRLRRLKALWDPE